MSAASQEITQNLFQFYRSIADLNGYETGRIGGVDYVWNRQGSWPAYVLGTPQSGEVLKITGAMERREVPAFWIMEDTPGFDLQQLEKKGIRVIRQWTGMSVDPSEFQDFPVVTGIELRRNDPNNLQDWLHLVNTELMTGSRVGSEVIPEISSARAYRWIVAYKSDRVVGTGLSFTKKKVTGLYMIVTEKSSRGMGIGSMITAGLIKNAVQAGAGTIVLHATNMGEGLYSRLGFRTQNRFHILWYLGI